MDFESYIGKERQLLGRIEKERAEMNSHEPNAWEGNYRLAADEIKLLKAGDYVKSVSEMAADAIVALDERMSQLRQLESDANARNEAFLKRVSEWETEFDARYTEAMTAMAREAAALDARNAELTKHIAVAQQNLEAMRREAESNLREISSSSESAMREISGKSEREIRQIGERTEANVRLASEQTETMIKDMSDITESRIKSMGETTEANLKALSKATTVEVEQLVASLKYAQAEFEASVNEKLEQDRQTIDRIKFMISTMNEIIKT
jgi:hypothetical protein